MLESFVLRWGYLAVGIGTFFEGETVLIAAGAMAHRGLLSLPLVMLSAFVGSVTGDQVWFQVGRRFGRPFLERRPTWAARSARNEQWLARYGSLFVLGFRFIYGVRTVTPLFLGASRYPLARFAILNVVGAAVWALAFGAAGWGLGASLEALLRRASRIEELVVAAVVIALAAWLVGRWLQRRKIAREPRP